MENRSKPSSSLTRRAMLAMSLEVARRVIPLTGSMMSGAELAVAMTGRSLGNVTS